MGYYLCCHAPFLHAGRPMPTLRGGGHAGNPTFWKKGARAMHVDVRNTTARSQTGLPP
ncbi:hypothetical protein SXCC_01004 [Gluconacetobacter sp. SXCC-1]|nr:hypothetical protein SXCC_01004 [Gluconacetobacter sp. SXCC-1]